MTILDRAIAYSTNPELCAWLRDELQNYRSFNPTAIAAIRGELKRRGISEWIVESAGATSKR